MSTIRSNHCDDCHYIYGLTNQLQAWCYQSPLHMMTYNIPAPLTSYTLRLLILRSHRPFKSPDCDANKLLPQAGYRLIDTFYILHVNFWYLLAVTAPPSWPEALCTLCQGLGASVHLPGLHRCIASTSKVQGGINFPLSHRSINLQVNKMGNIPILNFYNACIFLFYVFHDPPNARNWEWFVCVWMAK